MWNIEKLAMIFFMSEDTPMDNAENMTDTANSMLIKSVDRFREAKNTRIAKLANLRAYPASVTLPGHEASTCASGNQTEKGTDGTLTRNTSVAMRAVTEAGNPEDVDVCRIA